jgi:hypothetical protein
MATAPDPSIEELNRQSARLEAETRKLLAESNKLAAERLKLATEAEILPRALIFQAMIAFAAILGAGAAIAKLFFP